jgi:hypothetical protein
LAAEIPYDRMTPEQQAGYRSLIETRGKQDLGAQPQAGDGDGSLGAYFRTLLA